MHFRSIELLLSKKHFYNQYRFQRDQLDYRSMLTIYDIAVNVDSRMTEWIERQTWIRGNARADTMQSVVERLEIENCVTRIESVRILSVAKISPGLFKIWCARAPPNWYFSIAWQICTRSLRTRYHGVTHNDCTLWISIQALSKVIINIILHNRFIISW